MNTRSKTAESSGRSVSLSAPIQHQVLRSMDPTKVTKILKPWERYRDEAREQKKVPNMCIASFKVSVDRGFLKTMYKLERLNRVVSDISFDNLTSDHIEAHLLSLIQKEDDGTTNPVVIQEDLKELRMSMKVADPEAHILKYVHNTFQMLESVGYADFQEKI